MYDKLLQLSVQLEAKLSSQPITYREYQVVAKAISEARAEYSRALSRVVRI